MFNDDYTVVLKAQEAYATLAYIYYKTQKYGQNTSSCTEHKVWM